MMYRLLLFLFIPSLASAQVIPSSKRVDWSKAGIDSSVYVTPVNSVSITTYGGIGDSVTDNSSAIVSAMTSFGGSPGTILIPQGIFLFLSPISIPDNITLKGTATDKTTLLFDLGGTSSNCINISRTQTSSFVPATGGLTKNSDTIIIASAAGFNPGDMIELREQNGSWDVQPASWAAYSVGQMIRISSITGNTLHLEETLRIDYDPSLSPEVRKITPGKNISLECLRIKRRDAATSGYNIAFNYAYNCGIKNVESDHSAGAHIIAEMSSHITITGCYIHHAFAYDGTSTRGYGITLASHTSDCLIEDNVLEHLRHSMMVKQGANGNVFAYNYSFDPYRTETPTNAGGDISLHGHYAYANLFEGNIVQNIHIDQTWGPSGPYNTFFRNRAELYGIIMSSGSGDSMNFAGNEITHPSSGFYLLNGTGHFQYGNNVQGTIQPTGTSNLPDSSYYLSQAPSYWNNAPWPSIGPPNAIGSGSNPAKLDFTAGSPTGCWMDPLSIDEPSGEKSVFIYPNPSAGKITIVLGSPANETEVSIYDITGRIMLKEYGFHTNEITLALPSAMCPGVYSVAVTTGKKIIYTRLIRY